MFWNKVRPLFTDKIQTKFKITLIEKKVLKENGKVNEVEEVITDDKAIAEIFNEFYVNIVPNLKISMENNFDTEFVKTENPVLNAVNKYKNHPSIIMIKEKIKPIEKFSFFPVQYDDVLRKIRNLDPSKSSQQTDIPTKILSYNSEYFAGYFHENINFCFENSCLPSDLKFADLTPAYKKKSKNSKDNYRPVSILSNISKVYERCIYDQMEAYFETILSPNQCGFRKGFSAQHCLISLIEKWKKSIDNGGAFGALMTDLSKAFDCLSHELLIANLEAYGFDEKSLKLIYNYLSNRKQRVKINNSYSSWREILYGVPQGSILGPLLFNIFICDMFYFLENHELANYADDSTPYSAKRNQLLLIIYKLVIEELETSSSILFKWLQTNYMKVNTDKSHLLLSGNVSLTSNIDNKLIKSENEQVPLGVTIDSNLSFEKHINNLCKKASQELNALARISGYINLQKRRVIMKSFIISQFGYCPLSWMFHSKRLHNKINSIHERALRITYVDNVSSFQELLEKDNSVSIHHKNIQVLATEMFKIFKNLSPDIVREIFQERSVPYNLRSDNNFASRHVNSVYHGTESLSFLGPKIWEQVPPELKALESLNIFKAQIKKWIPLNCPCRLCRTYLPQISFIQN